MAFAIKPGQTLVFIGDSITDCGRRGAHVPLGEGYVRSVSELITARYPAHRLNVINSGISGNTVRDLFGRWTDDVIRHQPDWLSIKIGINDIHRWHNKVPDASVTAEQFEDYYDKILARTRNETKARAILVDPFYISVDTDGQTVRSAILKHLPNYINAVHRMAKKYKTRHVRTHEIFRNLLKHHPAEAFCPEPVHPYHSGHLVIAEAWLREMGW